MRRITISVRDDLNRIIQKMRGYMLGETGIEMSYSEVVNGLIWEAIIKKGKLTKKQCASLMPPYTGRTLEEDKVVWEYVDRYFKNELPRVVDDMIQAMMRLDNLT